MALEDLTGTKYINSLVAANPVSNDFRDDVGGHLRGLKNVLKLTFPNLAGAVTATAANLNLLVGETSLPTGLGAGSKCVFYQTAAPTGWTQDTTTSNLDGSTIRVETGAGGGAVAGTHDFASPPSIDHTHTDTFSTSAVTLTEAQLPTHQHYLARNIDSSDSTPDVSATSPINQRNHDSNNNNADYDFDGGTSTPTVGRTSISGSGGSHTHTVSGSVDSASLTEFTPKHIQVILCTKD